MRFHLELLRLLLRRLAPVDRAGVQGGTEGLLTTFENLPVPFFSSNSDGSRASGRARPSNQSHDVVLL